MNQKEKQTNFLPNGKRVLHPDRRHINMLFHLNVMVVEAQGTRNIGSLSPTILNA